MIHNLIFNCYHNMNTLGQPPQHYARFSPSSSSFKNTYIVNANPITPVNQKESLADLVKRRFNSKDLFGSNVQNNKQPPAHTQSPIGIFNTFGGNVPEEHVQPTERITRIDNSKKSKKPLDVSSTSNMVKYAPLLDTLDPGVLKVSSTTYNAHGIPPSIKFNIQQHLFPLNQLNLSRLNGRPSVPEQNTAHITEINPFIPLDSIPSSIKFSIQPSITFSIQQHPFPLNQSIWGVEQLMTLQFFYPINLSRLNGRQHSVPEQNTCHITEINPFISDSIPSSSTSDSNNRQQESVQEKQLALPHKSKSSGFVPAAQGSVHPSDLLRYLFSGFVPVQGSVHLSDLLRGLAPQVLMMHDNDANLSALHRFVPVQGSVHPSDLLRDLAPQVSIKRNTSMFNNPSDSIPSSPTSDNNNRQQKSVQEKPLALQCKSQSSGSVPAAQGSVHPSDLLRDLAPQVLMMHDQEKPLAVSNTPNMVKYTFLLGTVGCIGFGCYSAIYMPNATMLLPGLNVSVNYSHLAMGLAVGCAIVALAAWYCSSKQENKAQSSNPDTAIQNTETSLITYTGRSRT